MWDLSLAFSFSAAPRYKSIPSPIHRTLQSLPSHSQLKRSHRDGNGARAAIGFGHQRIPTDVQMHRMEQENATKC